MDKKILVLDLDGTLTNNKKEITSKTKQRIMEAQEMGHRIVLATGRPTPGVASIRKELELDRYHGMALVYNGGKIIDCATDEVLYQKVLPEEMVTELFRKADELQIGMLTYNTKGIIANMHADEFVDVEAKINHLDVVQTDDIKAMMDFDVNKCLGTAPVDIAPDIEKEFAKEFGDRINVGRSAPFFIELTPKGVDKAASLEKLCQILECSKDDMIACGDGFNDVSMIQFAGIGVAMANAEEPVKEAADYITYSNEEDGIAHVIEKFML